MEEFKIKGYIERYCKFCKKQTKIKVGELDGKGYCECDECYSEWKDGSITCPECKGEINPYKFKDHKCIKKIKVSDL